MPSRGTRRRRRRCLGASPPARNRAMDLGADDSVGAGRPSARRGPRKPTAWARVGRGGAKHRPPIGQALATDRPMVGRNRASIGHAAARASARPGHGSATERCPLRHHLDARPLGGGARPTGGCSRCAAGALENVLPFVKWLARSGQPVRYCPWRSFPWGAGECAPLARSG